MTEDESREKRIKAIICVSGLIIEYLFLIHYHPCSVKFIKILKLKKKKPKTLRMKSLKRKNF